MMKLDGRNIKLLEGTRFEILIEFQDYFSFLSELKAMSMDICLSESDNEDEQMNLKPDKIRVAHCRQFLLAP